MLDRIARPFVHYVNERTPYHNLVERSSFYRRPLIRQITMIVCAILTFCHVVNRFSWRERHVVDLTGFSETAPILVRSVRDVDQLSTLAIRDVDNFDFNETIPAFMDKYTCVCPYKPCGYTEFMWGELARGPSEADVVLGTKYQGRLITDANERRKIQAERNASVKGLVVPYFNEHVFDNVKLKTEQESGNTEFRACHPSTIYEICLLNRRLIEDNTSLTHVASSQVDRVHQLKRDLLQALDNGNVHEVANQFLKISEIYNSLSPAIFEVTFGDINGSNLRSVVLPQSLKDMKKIHRDFIQTSSKPGHSEQTIRNIVAYYYHEGAVDPIAQARLTLSDLPKNGAHYVVVDGKLMKADNLIIR